jgi:hypothetical protein
MSETHEDQEPPLEGRIGPPPAPRYPDVRHQCHHGCDCWQRGFARYVELTPRRSAEELDNQEAHALLRARRRAARDLRHRQPAMARQNRRVIEAHGALESALVPLRALAESGELARATRDHAKARDRDAPSPPLWLRIVQWPVIIAAGAFDTWFFTEIFQEINLGNSGAGRLETLVSAAPGLVLTAGLVVAGYGVSGAAYRLMRAHEHAQRGRTGWRRRLAAVWPWLLRLALPALLILVTGVWGVIRTLDTERATALLPARPVALLLVTLAVCAISVKAAAYDPRAVGVAASGRALWRRRARAAWLRRRAQRRLTSCRTEWSQLCALRDSLVGRVRGRYGEAYEFMTYARSLHLKAGELPPPFADADGGDPAATDLDERFGKEFAALDQPAPEWDALREVQRVISAYDPAEGGKELRRLSDRVAKELAVVV